METAQKFHQFIQNHHNILLIPSCERKFDTLPAARAIYHILSDLGKNTSIYFPDALPHQLSFLNIQHTIISSLNKDNSCTILIDTDKTPLERVHYAREGSIAKIILGGTDTSPVTKEHIRLEGGSSDWDGAIAIGYDDIRTLLRKLKGVSCKIDEKSLFTIHNRARPNESPLTETGASPYSEMLVSIIKEMGAELITEQVATALLTGLIASTKNFQNPNIKPQSLFAAAYLISKKAQKEKIIRHLYKTKPLEFIKLWGYMLAKFSYEPEKKIGWSTAEMQDFVRSGAQPAHVPMLIEELRNHFSQADFFILGVEERAGCRVVLAHALEAKRLAAFAAQLKIPLKNSSLLAPPLTLPSSHRCNKTRGATTENITLAELSSAPLYTTLKWREAPT